MIFSWPDDKARVSWLVPKIWQPDMAFETHLRTDSPSLENLLLVLEFSIGVLQPLTEARSFHLRPRAWFVRPPGFYIFTEALLNRCSDFPHHTLINDSFMRLMKILDFHKACPLWFGEGGSRSAYCRFSRTIETIFGMPQKYSKYVSIHTEISKWCLDWWFRL